MFYTIEIVLKRLKNNLKFILKIFKLAYKYILWYGFLETCECKVFKEVKDNSTIWRQKL